MRHSYSDLIESDLTHDGYRLYMTEHDPLALVLLAEEDAAGRIRSPVILASLVHAKGRVRIERECADVIVVGDDGGQPRTGRAGDQARHKHGHPPATLSQS